MRIKNKFFERFKSVLFTAVLISCLSLSPIRIANAEEPAEQKPYKATTVDECIQEEACVWHAFYHQVFRQETYSPIHEKALQMRRLGKWAGKINITFVGNQTYGRHLNHFVEIVKDIGPFANLPIEILANPSNYYIVISNEIDKEFAIVEKVLNKTFTHGEARKAYEYSRNKSNGAFTINLLNPNSENIYSSLTFVDTNKVHNIANQLAVYFYVSYGLTGNIKGFDFSLMGQLDSGDIAFTDLDKFVLYLLYQPEFKSGQNIDEAEKIFKKIFEMKKESFLILLSKQEF